MRNFFKIVFIVGFVSTGIAQTSANKFEKHYDTPPIFPGCKESKNKMKCFQQSFDKHVERYFKYPDEARKQGIEGRVSLLFVINEKGEVVNIRTRAKHWLLEEEASRIARKLPKMKPAMKDGKPVKFVCSFPINFKLTRGY